jgi:hypothetical protein
MQSYHYFSVLPLFSTLFFGLGEEKSNSLPFLTTTLCKLQARSGMERRKQDGEKGLMAG